MIRDVLRAEAVRLRQPTLLFATLGASAGFAVLITGITFSLANDRGTLANDDGRLTVAELVAHDGLAICIERTLMLTGLIAASVAAAHIAADFSVGAVRYLATREPRRLRLLAGKFVAAAIYSQVVTVVTVVSVVATAYVSAAGFDMSTDRWSTSEGLRAALAAALNLGLSAVGWTTIGICFGLIFRSAITAITVGAAYGIVENVVGLGIGGAARWLPAQALGAVAQGGTDDVPYLGALLTAAAFLTVLGWYCTRTYRTRDISE